MAKVSPQVVAIVRGAFERYVQEVKSSGLKENAQKTYLLHSHNFVRWLNDEFEPGATILRG